MELRSRLIGSFGFGTPFCIARSKLGAIERSIAIIMPCWQRSFSLQSHCCIVKAKMAPKTFGDHSAASASSPRHQGQTTSFFVLFTARKYCIVNGGIEITLPPNAGGRNPHTRFGNRIPTLRQPRSWWRGSLWWLTAAPSFLRSLRLLRRFRRRTVAAYFERLPQMFLTKRHGEAVA